MLCFPACSSRNRLQDQHNPVSPRSLQWEAHKDQHCQRDVLQRFHPWGRLKLELGTWNWKGCFIPEWIPRLDCACPATVQGQPCAAREAGLPF